MKMLLKKILQIGAALLSLISGLLWHLSALAQSSLAELQNLPRVNVSTVKVFTLLSLNYNTWAAEAAAVAGACLFLMLIFEN